MSIRSQYKTKQLEEIMLYLESVKGTHITAADICGHFRNKGIPIGTATVYRHLEKMVANGIVRKHIIDENSSACYEYVGEENVCRRQSCFHCKCEKCGSLIHVCCDELAQIQQHMLSDHGFEINSLRTVFYGLCDKCRNSSDK